MQFVIGLFIGAIVASGIWLYLINRPRGGYEPGHGFPLSPDDNFTALTLQASPHIYGGPGISWTFNEEPSGPPVGNSAGNSAGNPSAPETIIVVPSILDHGDVIYGPPETNNLPDILPTGRITRDALGLSTEPFPLSNHLGYTSTLIQEPIFRRIAHGM